MSDVDAGTLEARRAMDIGSPQRQYTVEPIDDPVPREQPAEPDERVPEEEPAEREPVPA